MHRNHSLRLVVAIPVCIAYSYLFRYTPDYNNYLDSWLSRPFILSLNHLSASSDPLARLYYSLVFFLDQLTPIADIISIFLPIVLFCYSSFRLKIYILLMALLASPFMYSSLINPRFFGASVLILLSCDHLASSKFFNSLAFFLLAALFHLGSVLAAPFLLLCIIFRFGRKYFFVLLALIFLSAIFSIQSFANYEWRLEHIGSSPSLAARPYAYYSFFTSYFTYWLLRLKCYSRISHPVIIAFCRTPEFCLLLYFLFIVILSFFNYNLVIARCFQFSSVASLFFLLRDIGLVGVRYVYALAPFFLSTPFMVVNEFFFSDTLASLDVLILLLLGSILAGIARSYKLLMG